MTATSVMDVSRVLKRRAANYTLRDGKIVNDWRVWDIELPSYIGVMSTVKDLVTWEAALAAGKVLKPATLTEMWTPVRLNAGWSYPYGFGWVVDERRGHRMISHTGITGTELSRFPDDGLTVVVLTNLGRTLSPSSRVNSWGLTYGVAGRYIKGLHVGPQKIEADPDPVLTARLREMLQHVAKDEPDPTLQPVLATYITPIGRAIVGERLATLKSFTFVTCDDVQARSLQRLGARVGRVCHYRAINADETRYHSFWLTADNAVADFWSSTE